jgi:hypothetical protein
MRRDTISFNKGYEGQAWKARTYNQEAEIRRITVQDQPRQKIGKTLFQQISPNPSYAEGIGRRITAQGEKKNKQTKNPL